MSKFEYDTSIPTEVIETLKRHLEPLQDVVPSWCERVAILWDAYQTDAVIVSNSEYEYRRTSLTFGPTYLHQSDLDKQEMVLHDLIHFFLSVLHHFACDILEELLPDKADAKLKTVYHKILKERNESVTTDLTTLFKKRIYIDKM